MTFNKEFMEQALKRVNELKQEIIEESKKVPNSKIYVKEKLRTSGIVSYSKCKKCHRTMHVLKLEKNPDGVGRVCIDKKECSLKT